jgi:general secretion pathway protein B
MSFILDALKKSETDRQRQNGPALFEVRVAPPRNGLPLWAIGLAALLAVNLVIVAWVLLRRPASAEVAGAPPTAQAVAGSSQPVPPPARMTTTYQPQGYVAQGYAPTPQQQAAGAPQAGPPGAQQGQVMPPEPGTVPVGGTAPTSPVAQTAGMTQPAPAYPATAENPSGAQQLPAGGNEPSVTHADAGGAGQRDGAPLNPDDYAPATDPTPTAPFGNHVSKNTSSGVPLYQDAALAPGAHLPELRLDLHVFAAKPQERFIMINMHKLHEGDSLPEGVHVDSITPEGAVLSKDGTRFLLPRD